MSGGHFDYQQWRIREIADTIERDIARALRPKPAMVHEDYWVIDEMESPHSYHSAGHYHTFSSYEEAESFLLSCGDIVIAEQKYADGSFFKNGTVFQSTRRYMKGTADDEQIPVLYVIRHCVFDHYPYDMDVPELNDETIETMKEAYRQIRIAMTERTQCRSGLKKNWRHWKKKSHQKTGLTLTTDGMSRSRKKFPAGVRDLGGDGKCFYGYHPDKEWYAKIMRICETSYISNSFCAALHILSRNNCGSIIST